MPQNDKAGQPFAECTNPEATRQLFMTAVNQDDKRVIQLASSGKLN